jgi:hypothetical protein
MHQAPIRLNQWKPSMPPRTMATIPWSHRETPLRAYNIAQARICPATAIRKRTDQFPPMSDISLSCPYVRFGEAARLD